LAAGASHSGLIVTTCDNSATTTAPDTNTIPELAWAFKLDLYGDNPSQRGQFVQSDGDGLAGVSEIFSSIGASTSQILHRQTSKFITSLTPF
jgi:hypothetical protein